MQRAMYMPWCGSYFKDMAAGSRKHMMTLLRTTDHSMPCGGDWCVR